MDALLQLIVPEAPVLPGLQRYQREFTWAGESYPQEPVMYRWGPQVELIKSEIQPFVVNLLPEDFLSKGIEVLEVAPKTLDLMERDINGEPIDWYGYKPDELLNLLLGQSDRWVMIFEPYHDQIDHIFRIGATESMEKLKAVLNRANERQGFIALPPRS